MNNKEQINPMMCDPETGICEIPGAFTSGNEINTAAKQNKIRILYFTDPICYAYVQTMISCECPCQ